MDIMGVATLELRKTLTECVVLRVWMAHESRKILKNCE
jgi:hypothetical protein